MPRYKHITKAPYGLSTWLGHAVRYVGTAGGLTFNICFNGDKPKKYHNTRFWRRWSCETVDGAVEGQRILLTGNTLNKIDAQLAKFNQQ